MSEHMRCQERCGECADSTIGDVFFSAEEFLDALAPRGPITARELAAWKSAADTREQRIRAEIAAEIEAFADDHSDVSDAYRHAALIAKGTPGP